MYSQPGLSQNYGSQAGPSNKKEKRKQKPAVRGLVRRKGEWKFWHYGFDIRDDLAGHPALLHSRPLPPLKGFPKDACKHCGNHGGGGCVVM